MKLALSCALLCAALPASAQDEPTPFWLAPPPASTKKPPKPAPPRPAKKKTPPPDDGNVPWQRPQRTKPAPVPLPSPAPAPKKREPQPAPSETPKKRAPVAPSFVQPAQPAAPEPDLIPDLPERRRPARPIEPEPRAPEPAPPREQERPRSPEPSAPRLPEPSAPRLPEPSAPRLPEPSAPRLPEPSAPRAPEPRQLEPAPVEEEEHPREVRRLSFDLLAGFWGRSQSDASGSTYDFAYGLRLGYGLFDDRLELDLLALRASATEGSPFLSTMVAHDLFVLRAFYVFGDRYALLLGGGGGVAVAQTHYSLSDPVAGSTSGLDASALKPVGELSVAGRVRIWQGLQARLELTALMRDGRLEILPLAGAGYAF